MKITDITRRAGRSLKQAKIRTFLTSMAISMGAFTIALSLAAGNGGRAFINDLIGSNIDPDTIYVQQQPKDETGDGVKKYDDQPTYDLGGGFSFVLLNDDDVTDIEGVENVTEVAPAYALVPKYIARDSVTDDKYELAVETYDKAVTLDYLAGGAPRSSELETVLPDKYLDALGFKNAEDAVGKTVVVAVASSNPLKEDLLLELVVSGVAKKSALDITGAEPLFMSVAAAKKGYNYANEGTPREDAYVALSVRVQDTSRVEGVKKSLQDKGYDAQTANDLLGPIFIFINVLQGVLIGFGALAIVTAIFGIINTQYISVLERTQQIGLMKALGMRRRDVGRLFMIEAAWIGLLGGTLGCIIAVGLAIAANPFIKEALEIDIALLQPEVWHSVLVVLALMLISVVAGILPARKAAKLDPIEALRTE